MPGEDVPDYPESGGVQLAPVVRFLDEAPDQFVEVIVELPRIAEARSVAHLRERDFRLSRAIAILGDERLEDRQSRFVRENPDGIGRIVAVMVGSSRIGGKEIVLHQQGTADRIVRAIFRPSYTERSIPP